MYFDLYMLNSYFALKTQVFCYPKFVSIHFDTLIYLHDQEKCDNYFVINRGACMLATLKIKYNTFNN